MLGLLPINHVDFALSKPDFVPIQDGMSEGELQAKQVEVDEEVSRAETEPETETKLEENEEKQVMSMDRKENEKSGGTRDNEVIAGADKIVPTYFALFSAKCADSQNLN